MPKGKPVVDFSDVGLIPPGEYEATVESVTEEISKSSGKPTLKWVFTVDVDGSDRKIFYNTSLQPQALFKLRELLEAMGLEVSGKMELDLAEYRGLSLGVKIDSEEYEGKLRDRIVGVMALEEEDDTPPVKKSNKKVEEDDDEDEDETPPVKGKKKVVEEDDDEDEDEPPVKKSKKK